MGWSAGKVFTYTNEVGCMKRALSLGVALLLLSAGCTMLPPYITHEVDAHNHGNSAVELTVEIQSEEGTVLNTSRELGTGEKWRITTQETSGTYTIHASTASGLEDTAEYSLPLAPSGRTSFARITIESGELNIEVIWEE